MQNLFIIRAVIFILFAYLLEYFGLGPDRSLAQVLKMETQVLNFFGFQIIAPTAKTFLRCCSASSTFTFLFLFLLFQKIISVLIIQLLLQIFVLRRFLRAAQASYKVMWLVQFIIYACFRRYQPLLIKK